MDRETDLAWLAGILEGEGSISITQSGRTGHYAGTVNITQRNEQFIRGVLALVQALDLPEPSIGQPTLQMTCYTLTWNSVKGSVFLQLVRPYFRHPYKIARADIYLKFFDPKRKHAMGRRKERRLLFAEVLKQRQLEKDENAEVPSRIEL